MMTELEEKSVIVVSGQGFWELLFPEIGGFVALQLIQHV